MDFEQKYQKDPGSYRVKNGLPKKMAVILDFVGRLHTSQSRQWSINCLVVTNTCGNRNGFPLSCPLLPSLALLPLDEVHRDQIPWSDKPAPPSTPFDTPVNRMAQMTQSLKLLSWSSF